MQIEITTENFPEAIASLKDLTGAIAGNSKANAEAGRAAANLIREHFRQRNLSIKRPEGRKSSNYWGNAAEAISSDADSQAAYVHIRHPGIALHYYGGTVYPRNADNLCIPLRNELYGVWPSEAFQSGEDKTFKWTNKKTGKAFIATSEDGKLTLHYLLLKSTEHTPDRSVLPAEQDLLDAAARSLHALLSRELAK